MPTTYSRGKVKVRKPKPPKEPCDYWLYVLRLEDGYFYVGITRDVEKRFKRHVAGKAVAFTRKHKPIDIFIKVPCYTEYGSESERMEREVALKMCQQFGSAKVYAGGFLWKCVDGQIVKRDV